MPMASNSGLDAENPCQSLRCRPSTGQEIAPLHEDLGFATVVLAGVELAISAAYESYNRP
jgi:hypothetical protein